MLNNNISDTPKAPRPISPHLTIYKVQITSLLSIGHRMSGIMLFFALALLCWWFNLWVFSKFDSSYLNYLDSWFAKFALLVISYGYFYHLCTGLRHLIWDLGIGFAIKQVNWSGWLAIIFSLALTICYWVLL
jgi:succinate dehydrogenase / fumarate reductase cytochrome b subunit